MGYGIWDKTATLLVAFIKTYFSSGDMDYLALPENMVLLKANLCLTDATLINHCMYTKDVILEEWETPVRPLK